MIKHIHSRRAEIFGVLTIFLFLQEYCKYFFIEVTSLIELYCDNEIVINKLNQLITDISYLDKKY